MRKLISNLKAWSKHHATWLTIAGMVVFGILLFMALSGCASPVTVKSGDDPKATPAPTGHVIYVKNSLWQNVPIQTVAKSVGRSISRTVSDSELLDAVTEYNAQTMDDFLRVYYDEAPDLADAPPVDVFIVRPTDYHVNMAQTGIARSLLVDNADGWRQDAQGQLLFIDHVPPPPVIEPPADPYAYFAIYGIDETGHIVYEDHCGYRSDRQFYQEDIGDYPSPEVYYPLRVYQINHEVVANPGWTLHADHTLYTPPVQ